MDEAFYNENLCVVAYDAVRRAMNDEPFTMTTTDKDEFEAIKAAVNQGIDAHLEACFVPDRGDSCEVSGRRASLAFSPESLPVLLRRLSEGGTEAGVGLVGLILQSLGFNDAGEFAGDRFPYSLRPGDTVVWVDPDDSAEQPRRTILLDGIRAQSYDDDAVVSISGRDVDGDAEVAFECLWGELEPVQ